MAKQNVSFFERHVEKIVVGVCGAVFAGVIALYGVQSPNRVTVGSDSLDPHAFYRQISEKGAEALRKMQSAHAPPIDEQQAKLKQILPGLKPPDYKDLPDHIAAAFVAPSPEVPGIIGRMDQKKDLAQILAPAKPLGSAGRAVAKLAPMAPITGELNPPVAPVAAERDSSDLYWITLASTINRKAQREKFVAANYNLDHMALLIVGIEVQRQMLLPSGEWGPIEKVQTYGPVVTPPVLNVQFPDQPDQEPFVPPEQQNVLDSFRKKIEDYKMQSELFLRPDVQGQLLASKSWWWEWSIPRKLDGVDVDLKSAYSILYPDEILPKNARRPGAIRPAVGPQRPAAVVPQPRAPGGRGGGGEGGGRGPTPPPAAAARPATPPVDSNVNREVMANMKKAEKALDESNPISAQQFYQAVVDTANAPEHQKKKAQDKLKEIQSLVETALKEKEEKEKARQEEMRLNYGPNVDPVWSTDISVVPGSTYRYQLRLLAVNSYAGQAEQLTSPKDAEKVVIPGEWSAWSDPIRAKPNREVFAYMMNNNNSVLIEIHRWVAGEWKTATAQDVGVGQPIVAKEGRVEVPYGGTIASIEPNHTYRDRVFKEKDNTIEYKDPVATTAVLLVSASGEVQEHLIKEDSDRRTRFNTEKSKEKEQIKALQELQPTVEQPRVGIPSIRPGGETPGAIPLPRGVPGGRNQN